MLDYLPVLILLLVLAAFLHEDAVLTVFYLLGGIYLLGTWWSHKALRAVRFQREYPQRAFISEIIPVRVRFSNSGLLPVPWLQLRESLPVELGSTNAFRSAISLSSHGKAEFEYKLYALKRGYYRIGPLYMRSGDILGLGKDEELTGETDHLIIYPRIVPLTRVNLPSRTPFGSIRHTQAIFEDPSRILGKREYRTGDSQRHIDWKASATSGRLQVKQFGPSIAIETVLFLNLDEADYDHHSRLDTTEMGIVVAASLANWVCSLKQSFGLFTNGSDPLESQQLARPIQSNKGRGHLMHVLDLLARVQLSQNKSFEAMLHRAFPRLPWGTTIILITSQVADTLLDTLFQARRFGLTPFLVLIGPIQDPTSIQRRANHFGVPVYFIRYDTDFDIWCR